MMDEETRKQLIALTTLHSFTRRALLLATEVTGGKPPHYSELCKNEILEWIARHHDPARVLAGAYAESIWEEAAQ